jgi:hypothetical protein
MIQVHAITSAMDSIHRSEKDAALAVVSDVAQAIDPVIEKRVLQKIDMYFMPAMLIGWFDASTSAMPPSVRLTQRRLWHGLL